jgi:hypothetical protein
VEPARAERNVASQDFVGNLFEVLDGEEARVFTDDRADMFPRDVFRESTDLLRGDANWQTVLAEHDIGIVLWEREEPTASLLAASPDWQTVFSDTRWLVACRRGEACDQLLG